MQQIVKPDFGGQALDGFWAELDPDVREALSLLESQETWTYEVDSFPQMFLEAAEALPGVVSLPLNRKARDLMVDLIPVVSAMPFGASVFAIAWLDANGHPDGPGWGMALYVTAMSVAESEDADEELRGHASVIANRIASLVRLNIATDVFSRHLKFAGQANAEQDGNNDD